MTKSIRQAEARNSIDGVVMEYRYRNPFFKCTWGCYDSIHGPAQRFRKVQSGQVMRMLDRIVVRATDTGHASLCDCDMLEAKVAVQRLYYHFSTSR